MIVDISQFQGVPDFHRLKREGVVAVYIKATEGETFVSPLFHEQWAKAGEARLIRGTYHFARQDVHSARDSHAESVALSGVTYGDGHMGVAYTDEPATDDTEATDAQAEDRSRGAVLEARHFMAAMRALPGRHGHAWKRGELRPVLDFEVGTPDHRYSPWRDAFFSELRTKSHHSGILYTFPGFNSWHRPPVWARQLWIAHFTTGPRPSLPGGYHNWQLWQYSSHGQLPGVHGVIDLSRLPHGRHIDSLRCKVSG